VTAKAAQLFDGFNEDEVYISRAIGIVGSYIESEKAVNEQKPRGFFIT
jgi:hypothetical protein